MPERLPSEASSRPGGNRDLALFNLALTLVLGFVVGHTLALRSNVFERHSDWVSTKPSLARSVMGAHAFVELSQAMARNRLNIAAWFGYQEVLLREPESLRTLSAEFWLDEDAYIDVLYDHRAEGFSGVRLSNRGDFPSAHFRATPRGAFRDIDEFREARPLDARRVQTIELEFEDTEAVVRLNGEELGRFARTSGPQRIGFRGSQREAWIDDVVRARVDGTTISEDFSSDRHGRLALAAMAIALAAIACAHLVAARSGVRHRRFGMAVAMLQLVLIALVAAAYVGRYLAASSYPAINRSQTQTEAKWIRTGFEQIRVELAERHAPTPAPGTTRLLFVGGSQTWGAGARTKADTWVRQTEHFLNRIDSSAALFECINGGASGFDTSHIVTALRDELLRYQPGAVVMNLGNNDIDQDAMEDNFRAILDLISEKQVKPVLVLEPNSPEKRLSDSRHGDLFEKHRKLQRIANDRGVPVIDMHTALSAQKNTGHLWWDFSHLTSFGQERMAEHLARELPTALGL